MCKCIKLLFLVRPIKLAAYEDWFAAAKQFYFGEEGQEGTRHEASVACDERFVVMTVSPTVFKNIWC